MSNIVKSLLLSALMASVTTVALSNPLYRYVRPADNGGKYTNDGLSWATAKNNIQDAINELHDYMNLQGITEGGYVFVRYGTYKPTESTNDESELPQYLSFKMYAGINVWGGWEGDEVIPDGSTDDELFNLEPKVVIDGPSGTFVLNQFETILDGNLSDDAQSQAKFVWSDERQRYVTTFPSNVYHVVTFATNGFTNGRANALTSKASLNVVTIRGGRAYDIDANVRHPYNAYGGGVYMVGNSEMFNSRVSECEASRDGGGVYMDGGGKLDHNIITDCQAMGLGIQYGRGGGICIDQAGSVEQSYVLNNVAREGAGIGMYFDADTAALYSHSASIHAYSAICKSSLISNNTSTTEAGGIYMDGGGVLDGVSAVRNRCNGIGAVINNILTGQAAGVFMVGKARAYNSVFWGGSIGTTSDSYDDIQFGAYNNGQDANKSHLGYVAINNNDLVNWSYSSTNSVMSLATDNTGSNNNLNYAVFQQPSPSAGVMPKLKQTLILTQVKAVLKQLRAAGQSATAFGLSDEAFAALDIDNLTYDRITPYISVIISQMTSMFSIHSTTGDPLNATEFMTNLSDGMFYVASYSFKPQSVSSLAGAGVQLSDLPEEAGVDLDAAELVADVLDVAYSPLCDLGCYNVHAQETSSVNTVNYVEPGATNAGNTLTVFVDPERSSTSGKTNIGASWDTPFKHLRDALHYMWEYKRDANAEYEEHKNDSPAHTYVKPRYDHYQVLVKEGTIHTAATATNERIGVSSIYMIDGVSVYGGYPQELDGTNLTKVVNGATLSRNPITYPSVISGSFSDAGYETNVGHLVNFCSVSNAIFDGFQLRYGNATGTTTRELGSIVSFDGGGGFVLTNAFHYDGVGLAQNAAAQIAAMSGNKVRNCIVTGCTARMGAAVFTYVPLSSLTLAAEFDNCIFHNNSVIYGTDQSVADVSEAGKEHSIVRVVNGANLTFNHCDFIRNVGVGIDAQSGSTVYLKNNVFYANLDRVLQNTNNFNKIEPGVDGYAKLCAPIVNNGAITIHGQNNRFDFLFARDLQGDNSKWRFSQENYLDNVNFDAASSNNLCNLTYDSSDEGNKDFTYPLFKNATRNAGLSTEGDITFFGGTTDWMPNAMSPLVNTGLGGVLDYDITVVASRNHGGSPDVGAVENSVDQPENPSVMLYETAGTFYDDDQHSHTNAYTKLNTYYVRWYDSDTKGGDGSSWNAAINGNADYDMKTGKLATVDEGTALVGEMVDSYDAVQNNEYSSSSIYRLLNKGANMYMTEGGAATSDIGSALQFVFIKTGKEATYWNGMTVPVYKFYYYVTRRHSDEVWLRNDDVRCYKRSGVYYLMSDNTESTGEYTYTHVQVVITIESTDCPVYVKDGVEYYVYNNNIYAITDNTHTNSLGTDLSGYSAVYEECNVRHERQGVGYLQISLDTQGNFVAGNSNDISQATEFFLVGDPNNLYVIPNTLYEKRGEEGKGAYKYTGVVMVDKDSDPTKVTYGAGVGSVLNNTCAVWAISASGSSNQYAHLGYRLKSFNSVNGVAANTYISKETTTYKAGTKRNDPTYTTLKGTASDDLRDVIHFEGAIGGDESILISTQTSNGDKGFGYEYYNNTYYYSLKPNSDYWHVTLIQEGAYSGMYTVRIPDGGHGLAYSTWQVANGESFLQLTNDENKQVYWVLEPIYTRTNTSSRINGLQYAINSANASFRSDGQGREIWVGEGTYSTQSSTESETVSGSNYQFEQNYVYKLLEGASMCGGFPTVGNPTLNERDPKKYETILSTDASEINEDPSSFTSDNNDRYTVGRVLYQANNFTKSTTVDGFTIQRGYLNQAMRGTISANLDNLFNNTLKQNVNVGMFGGAGALIRTGLTLENCKVTNNMAFFNSWTETKVLGRTWASRTQTGTVFKVNQNGSDAGDYHVAGGGVSSLGGEIKNCEILNNGIYFFRSANSSTCAYGAGVFMTSGSISNTVIAGNQITCNSNVSSSDQNNDIQAGAGAYLYGGAFYNNTIDGNVCNHSAALASGFSSWVMSALGQLKINYCAYIPGVFIHNDIRMYNTIIANNTANEEFGNMTVNHKIYGYPVASLGSNWVLAPDKISAYNCCIYKTGNIVYNGTTYSDGDANGEQVYYRQKTNSALCSNNIFVDPQLTSTYRQQDSSPTVNTGTQNIKDGSGNTVLVPEHDAAYETRVQDCQIDMGAYEHNYASNIVPTTTTDNGVTTATYYVKSGGDYGNATASNAGNAACVEKLQRVLDAAGRYKYTNPTHVVNVYLAETENDNFYRPLRESDPSQSSNVRSWSIMVPRGVNVYGGYVSTTFAEDTRSITGHQSIIDGRYSISGNSTKAYHVVTFTDVVYDPNGMPYLSSDAEKVSSGAASSYVSSMSSQVIDSNNLLKFSAHGVTGRAVLNGLIIQNGNADGTSSSNSASKVYTGYGGAAVVPGFASIRNCIIQNNNANYGGGLFLQKGATVCGTLIKGNTAKTGGGVYFEELDQTPVWTNFSTENAQAILSSTVMQFAQLVNSTITGNSATRKGGGLYFQNNAHVMSSAIWGNECGDQANVAGQTNAYSFALANEITFGKYPFCYSAVENNRLPGANNISVSTDNDLGVRFLDIDHLDDLTKFATASNKIDPYYRISDFSQLAKTGSSVQSFELSVSIFGATTSDYMGTPRISSGYDYVDIGATAIQQTPKSGQDITTILPRLYVAQPKDVDKDAQQAMILSNDPIYSQKGSSFAYPFQSLDEALEYIRNMRKKVSDDSHKVCTINGTDHYVWEFARNIPFEIIMGKGFFYPSRDIYNVQGESLGNTFLVPEGVSIVGGFDVNELGSLDGKKRFYGQRYKLRSAENTAGANSTNTYFAVPTESKDNIFELMCANLEELPIVVADRGSCTTYVTNDSVDFSGYRMIQFSLDGMKAPRQHTDNNVNNLIEPWEFTNQTVLSGKVINSDEAANAYHVISVIADETLVGALPVGYDYSSYSPVDIAAQGYKVGMRAKEKGAPIDLNGLQISDGQAYKYSKTAANGFVWMDYYHGGGVMVDGNWYRIQGKNADGTPKVDSDGNAVYTSKYQHKNISNAVGYHNIPIIVDRCHFTNNKGGYGGAVSANTDIYFSNNSFTSNQAIAYKDAQVLWAVDGEAVETGNGNVSQGQEIDGEIMAPYTNIYYPGNGGAIYSTKQMTAANCIFENNEATNTYDSEPVAFKSPRSVGGTATYQFGGCGGAVYSGAYAIVQFFNCNFVRNKANMYPAIFARYPNHYKLGVSKTADSDPTKVTAEPALAYNKVIGSVFWGNEGTNTTHPFSAQMIMASAPVMSDYAIKNGTPHTQEDAYELMPDKESGHTVAEYQTIYDTQYAQSLWFCAYEEHTHITPTREYDVRLAPFSFSKFVERSIREYVYAIYEKKLENIDRAYTTTAGVTTFNYENEADYKTFCSTYKLQDYNQIIHSDNSHINGPNFTKPSTSAGLAGYMQDADWMPKRINRLTDNGWGFIVQKTLSTDIDGVIYDKAQDGNYNGDGAFFTVLNSNAKFKNYVAMGDGTYMIFDAKNVSDQTTSKTVINRISKMPTPTVPTFDNQESYAYIDIGVFEFQHQRLGRPLGDVDYIWVAPAEKPENGGAIGTSWLRPTSDIQRAIETLLSNRNGHKKYLYIVQGDYKPFYNLTPAAGSSMEHNAGFTINTENLNSVALSPTRCTNSSDQSDLSLMNVPSLTILGGFSEEVQTTMYEYWHKTNGGGDWEGHEGELADALKGEMYEYYAPETYRDPETYPVTFYSDNGESHTMLDVVDARQWYGRADGGNYAPRLMDNTVIPITIDGVNFNNSSAASNVNRIGGIDVTFGSAINYAMIEKYNNPKFSYDVGSSHSGRVSGGAFSISSSSTEVSTGVHVLELPANSLTVTLDQDVMVGEKISVTCYANTASDGTYGVQISDGVTTKQLLIPDGTTAGTTVDITLEADDFVGKYSLTITGITDKPVNLKNISLYGAKVEAVEIPRPELNTGITSFGTATGAPKLTISRCKFSENGKTGENIPTINIASKGGKTLIYNSLFYGNNGTAIVGDNITLVNNTIANNVQGIELTGSSEMHGNVLWNNTTEYSLPADLTTEGATYFTHNAITGANPSDDWTAGLYNVHLGTTNDDIQNGPNFVDPANGNYHLKPSLKLLNAYKHEGGTPVAKVNDAGTYYNKTTLNGAYGTDAATDTQEERLEYWNDQKDLQNKYRLVDDYLDLGAYEYQNKLMTYAFYNPNVTKSGDGTSWEKAYGFGNLQNAIDLVAVATKDGEEIGFVFAKGGRDGKSTGENVIIRNGVQVFGSIATAYNRQPKTTRIDDKDVLTPQAVTEYTVDLRTQRPGMAGPTTNRTIVNKVSSALNVNTTLNTILDGFEVRENLDIHPKKSGDVIISNSIVASNAKNGGVNTSNVWNSLVYNTLFRGEYAQLQLNGTEAYAVNVTSQKPFAFASEAVRANQVLYCRDNVTPTRILLDESGNVMDPNLEFQLVEDDSYNLNQGIVLSKDEIEAHTGSGLGIVYTNTTLLARLNREYSYSMPGYESQRFYPLTYTDRDLLGNPRKIGDKVDNGAFESWNIAANITETAKYYELLSTGAVVNLAGTFDGTENIAAKVRYYPHEGSYIYLKPGANLVLDASLQKLNNSYDQSAVVTHYGHDEYAVVPGYVMMREGSSVYGQGQSFLTNKITVEKSVNKYGDVIALPFAMKYLHSTGRASNPDNDGTSEALLPTVYVYNGERRSMRDNYYRNGWSTVTDPDYEVPAFEGVRIELYGRSSDPDADNESDLVKILFTSTGKNVVDYAYSESGATKTVQLASHDEYGTTTAEDMGWNCFGSPYLVSNFQTNSDIGSGKYSMQIPHYIYQYHYEVDANNDVKGSGEYMKVPSWQQYNPGGGNVDPKIILGEGVFTQTATFNEYENLVFKAPTYVAPSSAPESRSILYHTMFGGDEDDDEMQEELGTGLMIYVKKSELHIEGLEGGERIAICSTDGRVEVVHIVEEDEHEFVSPITPGVHAVRVDNCSVVIMNNAQ